MLLAQATNTVKDEEDEKGWNLEDEAGFDEEDDEEMPEAKPAAEANPAAEAKAEDAMDLEEGGDEIDPLDAFMAGNDAKVAPLTEEEPAAVQGTGQACCTNICLCICTNMPVGIHCPAAVQ